MLRIIETFIKNPSFYSFIIFFLVFLLLLGVLLLIGFLLIRGIRLTWNKDKKTVDIGKQKRADGIEMIHISVAELEVHFGGVETLKEDNGDKKVRKVFDQSREAFEEIKTVCSDLEYTFLETFKLETSDDPGQEFDSIINELKFVLANEIIDIIYNNHLNLNGNEWKMKKSKIVKRLMREVKNTIKKGFNKNKFSFDWETFDKDFFNQHQIKLKDDFFCFIEVLKNITDETDCKISNNNNNIEIIKNFYKEETSNEK